jgi:hypothetical protein
MATPFVVLREINGACGRGQMVRDRATSENFFLRKIPLGLSAGERKLLGEAVKRAAAANLPPEVLRYRDSLWDEYLLVRQWATGKLLRDLLRTARTLDAASVIAITERVAPLVDRLSQLPFDYPTPLLDKLYLRAQDGASTDAGGCWAERPFSIWLDPLRVADWVPEGLEGDEIVLTVNAVLQRPTPGRAVLDLAIELLGGPPPGSDHLTPLNSLRENGNARLRELWLQKKHPSAVAVMKQLHEACEADGLIVAHVEPPAPAPEPEPEPEPEPDFEATLPLIPARSAAVPEPTRQIIRVLEPLPQCGRTLQLRSRARDRRSLFVAADEQFRIGRSSQKADAVITIEPHTPERLERESALSRVHAHTVILGGIPMIRDGDGKLASANGSSFNGELLSAEAARPIEKGGVLDLHGAEVSLRVRPIAREASPPGDGAPSVSPWLPGAYFFQPEDPEVPNDALWLLSSVGLTFREYRWDAVASTEGAPPPLVLHRWKGGFLVVNQAAVAPVVMSDRPLAIGGKASLFTGQILRIGEVTWDVEVREQ